MNTALYIFCHLYGVKRKGTSQIKLTKVGPNPYQIVTCKKMWEDLPCLGLKILYWTVSIYFCSRRVWQRFCLLYEILIWYTNSTFLNNKVLKKCHVTYTCYREIQIIKQEIHYLLEINLNCKSQRIPSFIYTKKIF